VWQINTLFFCIIVYLRVGWYPVVFNWFTVWKTFYSRRVINLDCWCLLQMLRAVVGPAIILPFSRLGQSVSLRSLDDLLFHEDIFCTRGPEPHQKICCLLRTKTPGRGGKRYIKIIPVLVPYFCRIVSIYKDHTLLRPICFFLVFINRYKPEVFSRAFSGGWVGCIRSV